jgi:hypothetical protein
MDSTFKRNCEKSFSLQRSEMFIATSNENELAPLGAKCTGKLLRIGSRHRASYRALAHNKQLLAINISPLQGEAAISKLLHEVEFAL